MNASRKNKKGFLEKFLDRMFGETEQIKLENINASEIPLYSLWQLNLVLPDWVKEFRDSPFYSKAKAYGPLRTALNRYHELTGRSYLYQDGETGEIIWPTEEDLKIMDRLEERKLGIL